MRFTIWITAAALASFPPIAMAFAKDVVDPSCRREIITLCGINRSKIGPCLKTKMDQLTPACKTAVEARVAQMLLNSARRAGNGDKTALTKGGTEFLYGSDAAQALDYYPVVGNPKAPLVFFIHGGGWSVGNKRHLANEKASFYNGLGYAFASVNYRLVPQVKPDGQAQDIAAAIAYLRRDAAKLGLDPDRIVVMGHSAGAHLAALVSSDTHYLDDARVPLASIKGAILLDGAGYDVAKQMQSDDNMVQELYTAAFTHDPAAQKALSPVAYVGAPNITNWLLLHVESRVESGGQARELSDGLAKNGAKTIVVSVPNSTHMSVNADSGKAGSFIGDQIAKFLKAVF